MDWHGGSIIRLPDSLLPPVKGKKYRRDLLRKAGAVKADACFHCRDGRSIYMICSRGTLCRLRLTRADVSHDGASSGDAAASPGDKAASGSSSGGAAWRVFRMGYTYTGFPIVPPEIHHSRYNDFVMITTRNGLVMHHDRNLTVVDRGYSEPVDHTALVSARLAMGDAFILALPTLRSGHMAGGVYSFRRGVIGEYKLRMGPLGGIALFDVHPSIGIVAGVTTRGQAFILQQVPFTFWPGPMFPPGFSLMLTNRPHAEAEDEFDREWVLRIRIATSRDLRCRSVVGARPAVTQVFRSTLPCGIPCELQ